MIKITRTDAPEILARLGPGWAHTHVKDLEEGKAKLNFGEGVYGHADVRSALRAMQHSKCCYCEVHMDEYTPRHVEHWRPKGAVKQDEDAPELKPGYFWLAYTWDNLFLACWLCNSVHKRTLFPLRKIDELIKRLGLSVRLWNACSALTAAIRVSRGPHRIHSSLPS